MGDILFDKSQTSTAQYASVGILKLPTQMSRFAVSIKETGNVKSVKYKILGSYDGTNYSEIKGETTILKNAFSTPEIITVDYVWIDIQIIDGDGHGNARVVVAGG